MNVNKLNLTYTVDHIVEYVLIVDGFLVKCSNPIYEISLWTISEDRQVKRR